MSASVGRLAASLLIETESVRSAERWANEMTDPGSSGGHSQSYSSSRKERGETKSCDMQSVCEERGRLQLHTGGKKAKAAQLQLPPQFRLAEKSPAKKEEQRRVCEEALTNARTLAAIHHITHYLESRFNTK